MYIHTGEREERVFDLIDKKKKLVFNLEFWGKEKKKGHEFLRCVDVDERGKINFEVNCSNPPIPPGLIVATRVIEPMLTSRYEISRVRSSCHRTSFPRWRFFLARIFSNSTIRHANTFENEFPSCCVAISNIQQNLFKYSKASHLSPYLAKIVFISTFRIEKMDLAERWRREFESSEAKLGRVRLFSIWWPAPHNLEWILSIPGVGRRRTCIVELGYDCTRMCTRRHDESTSFETLPLSLSLDAYRGPVKEWPPLGFSPNLGGEGRRSGNRAPWYGMPAPEASSAPRPAYIFLLGSCARMLSRPVAMSCAHANLTWSRNIV